ncbi:MAG TPA: terpene synthase family protein, partial [Chloroflexota bacterium]
PGYVDYVANGLYSIGGPPHVWASLITIDDPSILDRLPQLSAMERAACICIRLANDLQSFDKEVREGKINALVLLSQQATLAGLSLCEAHAQATTQVRAEINEGLSQLVQLRETARTATGRPEAAIADIARFVCDFYGHHDYHTVGTQLRPTASRDLHTVAAKRTQNGLMV